MKLNTDTASCNGINFVVLNSSSCRVLNFRNFFSLFYNRVRNKFLSLMVFRTYFSIFYIRSTISIKNARLRIRSFTFGRIFKSKHIFLFFLILINWETCENMKCETENRSFRFGWILKPEYIFIFFLILMNLERCQESCMISNITENKIE